MSAMAVLTFEVFHKVYYYISANKSKPTQRAGVVNRKRYMRRSREALEEEPDAGRDNCRSWNRSSSQVEPSSQDFRVQVTSVLYKQVIFDPCASGLFKSSLEIPVRAGHSWTKNELYS